MCKTEQKTFTVRYNLSDEENFKKVLHNAMQLFNEKTGTKAIIRALEYISNDLAKLKNEKFALETRLEHITALFKHNNELREAKELAKQQQAKNNESILSLLENVE